MTGESIHTFNLTQSYSSSPHVMESLYLFHHEKLESLITSISLQMFHHGHIWTMHTILECEFITKWAVIACRVIACYDKQRKTIHLCHWDTFLRLKLFDLDFVRGFLITGK